MKYVIMKDTFGSYWIGQTELDLPKGTVGFNSFKEARQAAMSRCTTYYNRYKLEFMKEDDLDPEDLITDKKTFRWLAR